MGSREHRVVLLATLAALALFACGEDEKRFSDDKIIEKLNLEEVEGQKDYAIDGDLFCSVERRLLNTRTEVEDAVQESEVNLVVGSREGNVGVIGVPVFASDCRDQAREKLNRLDPEQQE